MKKTIIPMKKSVIIAILVAIMVFVLSIPAIFAGDDILGGPGNIVADKYVRISLINQEPDPVEPGKIVRVRFKIVNYGQQDTNAITIGIQEDFPFTLVRGEPREQYVGVLEKRQYGDKSEIIEWKLLVDKDAPEGENNISLYYKESGVGGVITYDEIFNIEVRTSDAVMEIKDIITTPETVKPGQEAKVGILLKNMADSFLKDVKVKLDLTGLDVSTVSSINEQIIQKINGKEETLVEFTLLPEADIDLSVIKIPLNLEFKDNINNVYTQNSTFGLVIGSPVEHVTYLEDTDITSLDKAGEATIRVSNKGVNNIKFLTMELKPSSQYEILSTPKEYVGKIDSDDYESVTYKIYPKESDDNNIVTLRVLLEFKDNYNKAYAVEEEIPLKVYDTETAQKYGLVPKPSYTGLIVVIVIIIAVVAFIIYRRRKKKKQLKS